MKSMKNILAEFREYSEKVNSLEKLIESREARAKQLEEDRHLFNEISANSAERIYDWMRDTDGMPYDFEDLFDGAMRVQIPLASEAQRNLAKVVQGLSSMGWNVPTIDIGYGPHKAFEVKRVKQKLQRLAADGGGEYEVEVSVADLRLVRKTQKVIPAGPRQGETIEKKEETTMSKAIARLAKSGKISTDLLKWWQNSQGTYTRDGNHKAIEKLFDGDDPSKYSIVISRHPIDVLRMSDIGSIRSCHSEGSEYFHCAVAEAKGHGPIAYLVNSSDLENHLMDQPDDLDPTQVLGRAMDSLDRDEFREKMAKEFDLESPAGRRVYIETWAETRDGDKWLKGLQQRIDMSSNPEKFEGQFMNAKAKQLDVPVEELKHYYRVWLRGEIDIFPISVKKAEYEKARKAVYEKEPAPADLKPISDFDDQELFRDRDRGVQGISAEARLRLRKFEEPMRFGTFAVPELRMYGKHIPGFKEAVTKWAADSQREQFVDDEGGFDTPRQSDLTRRGGSYGDNRDGEILNRFFEVMSGNDEYEGPYGNYDVARDGDDEESEFEDLFAEYEERVEELNRHAANALEHASVYAEVEDTGDGQPYVYASADISYEIPLNWKDYKRDGDYYIPSDQENASSEQWEEHEQYVPLPYGGNYADRNGFDNALTQPVDYYPEETDWSLKGTTDETVYLLFRHSLRMEDGADPDALDSFIDYIQEIDGDYRTNKEAIRRNLVEEGYIAPSDWDNLEDDFSEMEETLQNWKVYGIDDDDGEVRFRLQSGQHGYMLSGIKWPYAMGSRYSTIESLRSIFGGTGTRHIGASRYLSFDQPDGQSRGAKLFNDAFRSLQDAANEYARRQMTLDFGPKYEKNLDYIQFGKHVEMGLDLVGVDDHAEVAFIMTVKVFSEDDVDSIKQAFSFVKFLDKNISMLKRTVVNAFANEVLAFKEQNDAALLSQKDGTDLKRNIKRLRLVHDAAADMGNENSIAVMKIIQWAEQNFDKMKSDAEKITITRLTDNMAREDVGMPANLWDDKIGLPVGWEASVKTVLVQQGASFSQKERYNASYLKGDPAPDVYSQEGDDEPARLQGTIGEPRPAQEVKLKEEIYKRLQKKIAKKKLKAYVVEKLENQKELQKEQVRNLVKSKLLELDPGYTQRVYRIYMRIAMAKERGGKRDETENEVRGVTGVTTVKVLPGTTRQDGANYYADAMVKFVLLGQQSVTQYIKGTLMPALNKIEGLSILRVDQWEELKGLREYISMPGDVGKDRISPTPSIDQIAQSWIASGGERATQAMAHDLAQQVRQVTMMPVEELMKYLGSAGNMFSGTKNEFDDMKQKFISGYHIEPVMVAIGKNGRVKVVNGDDAILVAKDLGLKELPTVFSLQLQV